MRITILEIQRYLPDPSSGSFIVLGSVRGSSKEVVPTSRWSVSLVEGLVLGSGGFSHQGISTQEELPRAKKLLNWGRLAQFPKHGAVGSSQR